MEPIRTRFSGVALIGAALLVFSPLLSAQERQPRRLETVTWNSVTHKLTWVISTGEKDANGKFKAARSNTYVIDMDDATMTLNDEGRRFSKDEAANVHVLMDLIAKYAVDSTIWWDQGQGDKMTKEEVDASRVSERPKNHPAPKTTPKREQKKKSGETMIASAR